jgi:DNA replication protein DnaC
MNNLDALHARAKALCLHGLLAHWHDATAAGWLPTLIEWEEQERARRSLERRLKEAHIGRFKPLCDFDWSWPKRCDQAAIEALMTLEFLNDATNAILVGPNGIDEVGYLSYSNRHADLLFELISRRYENKSTLVTTNRPFAEWREVFPTAACVASLIDRLVHHAEIIAIDGESYRLKEATERSEKRGRQRRGAKP